MNNTGTIAHDTSAVLDVNSSDKGVLLPRLSANQRDAIIDPEEGLMIYNADSRVYEFFDGVIWQKMGLSIPNPPVAPADLAATAIDSSQIDLSWADNSDNETGFEIWRSTTSGSGFTLIWTAAADVIAFSDEGLSSGVLYYYKIRAAIGNSKSNYTNEVSANTQ